MVNRPLFDFSPWLPVLAVGHYGLAGLAALFGLMLAPQPIFFALGLEVPAISGLSSCGAVVAAWMWGVVGFVLLAYAVAAVVAGVNLRRGRRLALCRVVAALSCLFFPFGTAIGGVTLYALRGRTAAPPPGASAGGAAVLLVAALALPAAVAGEEASPFGVNVHAPEGKRLHLLLDEAAAGGAGWVRVDFVWADVQPARGRFVWRRYDEVVAAARARGLSVLGLLQGTPEWATDGRPGVGVPRRIDEWQLFCFAAALRYRGAVDHWEVWNEPNLPRFFAGDRADYIDHVLVPAADALHAASPRARVGGPALSQRTAGASDWHRWLYEVLLRAGDRLDFATHHLYDLDGHRDVARRLERSTPAGGDPRTWDLWPPSVREVLVAGGWFGRPFWLTETGWPTAPAGILRAPSEAWQARELRGLLADWSGGRPGRGWLHKVFVYELADDPGPGIARLGLLRPDLSRKPAWTALRDAAAAWRAARPPPAPVLPGPALPLDPPGRSRTRVR